MVYTKEEDGIYHGIYHKYIPWYIPLLLMVYTVTIDIYHGIMIL
jgi:hypothetical protein